MSGKNFLDCIIYRSCRLCRAALAILAASLSHVAVAQSASPLTFVIPAVQGPGTKGFGIVSDPTIQPFSAPGLPAPIGRALPVDLRGNGRPDVLLCHANFPPDPIGKAPCRVLRPLPDGSVTDITRLILGMGTLPLVQHPREIVVGDFNHDGRADMFIADNGYDAPPFPCSTNVLLISNADGTYTDRSSTLPQAPDFSHSACVGDIDGDGNLDIYVGNTGGGGIAPYFLIGKGDGTFTQTFSGLPPPVASVDHTFLSCLLLDVDQDGRQDLVLGNNEANGYVDSIVLFNDGAGDFARRLPYVLPPWSQHTVVDIVTLDINRDGRPDLIMVSQAVGSARGGFGLQVLINQGNGNFADETASRLPPSTSRDTGPFGAFIRLTDFNGDGWEDFYADSNGWDESLPRLWLNNGNGTWTPVGPDSLPKGSTFAGLHAVDFDGDGRSDLLRLGFGPRSPDIGYRSFLNRTPRTVPSEPLIGIAASSDRQAWIFFTAPLGSGASPITGYTATCSPGTFTGVVTGTGIRSPIMVPGLTNGQRYACSVTATNGAGISLASGTVTVTATVRPRRRAARHT